MLYTVLYIMPYSTGQDSIIHNKLYRTVQGRAVLYIIYYTVQYRTGQDRIIYYIRRTLCSYVYCRVINKSKTVDAELGQEQKISGNITSHMMRSDSQMPYRNLFFLNI